MTVRLWLMIADCWRCESSIELTEEQEREARRVLQQRAASNNAPTPPQTPLQTPADSAVTGVRQPSTTTERASTGRDRETGQVRVVHQPAPPPHTTPVSLSERTRLARRRKRITSWLHDLTGNMPAWLISLLFHGILLTILGLLTNHEDTGPYITLSSRINRVVREGGDTRIVDPTDRSVFDLGVPESMDLADPAERRAMVRADQDARQLRLTDPDNPYLPDVTTVKQDIVTHSRLPKTLAARDPRVRVEMVKREGGTTLTEAAVARGLRWLARHQNVDGSWSLNRFQRRVMRLRPGRQYPQ